MGSLWPGLIGEKVLELDFNVTIFVKANLWHQNSVVLSGTVCIFCGYVF